VTRTRICIPLFCVFFLAMTSACNWNYDHLEYFDGVPHLTNEQIGMFNYVHSISVTPPELLPAGDWGPDMPFGFGMGEGANMQRYNVAFTSYGVSMVAEHTPGYRKPYIEAIDGLIQKMLDPTAWDYWLDASWGGDDPIHPHNIMYTGHLQLMMAFYERQAGDQKYILNDVELITRDGLQRWTTNLADLSADIHNISLTNQDSQGNNYYSVPCETPWVFTCCNTIDQLAFNILPSFLGLNPQDVNVPFLTWHEENMFDPASRYFYTNFAPFEDPPFVNTSLTGGYSSWSHMFIHGFDPLWVEERYPEFIANALEYIEPGKAVVRFGGPGEEADLYLIDLIGTGYAMALTREMGDEASYMALRNGFDYWAGEPAWSGSIYGYFSPFNWPVYKIFPNGFTLWAEAMNGEINFRSVVESPRGPEFYEQPYLAAVTNPGTFVNQAIWDDPVLYITINGAHVTTDATNLVVRNLKADRTYQVLLNDEVYTLWTQAEGEMTITTPPLSSSIVDVLMGSVSTQRFQIIEEPVS